ncbi:NAD(+)/NADH kinase [Phycisphaera mikurensis]|uniref:NAD kinase n=1 Tax=Phycisphaera mikurensis (strain NBRC 102666 / KCTC 22515 / FYK2301M01) TaxID=1142394 RepID=I0IEB7_PHYMF|nr:NAD(+)/NADH kinase [Phycisphaera mikurensis]MBB6441406.1 NAD+ kinase [Phycisphaera mikurensis]BAM03605.1 inorganic polyphosphate/ATP-NAD kinase [Phycisphaera mikurensis NBRC 102666]
MSVERVDLGDGAEARDPAVRAVGEAAVPAGGVPRVRVLLLVNAGKEPVLEALRSFEPWLEERAEVVGRFETGDTAGREDELPDADVAMVLGGDGTFLSQARVLVDRGVPMLGINFGKVGFLAEWDIDYVKRHWASIACGGCRVTQRILMDVDVYGPEVPLYDTGAHEPLSTHLAMNDAVINAGPPYRVCEFDLAIEPAEVRQPAVTIAGDGIVVSTPSGSTAYNLSAGGPIVSPGVEAMMITALSPYTLAFRPIVFGADADVWITLTRGNDGTALVIDGQAAAVLEEGSHVHVRRHHPMLTLIQNPELTYWSMLSHKMRWAVRPRKD